MSPAIKFKRMGTNESASFAVAKARNGSKAVDTVYESWICFLEEVWGGRKGKRAGLNMIHFMD